MHLLGCRIKQGTRRSYCRAATRDDSIRTCTAGSAGQTSPTEYMDLDSPHTGEHLNIVTWNVMGLTAVQEDLRHLLDPRRDCTSIDIMVLTETKLMPQQHGKLWLKTLFEGWHTHFSSNCPTDGAPKQERCRSGSGGIIVACRKTGLGGDFQRTKDVPQRLAGHFELLKSNKHNAWLVGVYMPCNDQSKRTELYDFLSTIAKDASRLKVNLIAAGDWNAVWQSSDRCLGKLSLVDIKLMIA